MYNTLVIIMHLTGGIGNEYKKYAALPEIDKSGYAAPFSRSGTTHSAFAPTR